MYKGLKNKPCNIENKAIDMSSLTQNAANLILQQKKIRESETNSTIKSPPSQTAEKPKAEPQEKQKVPVSDENLPKCPVCQEAISGQCCQWEGKDSCQHHIHHENCDH